MIPRSESDARWLARLRKWHRWFAWKPIYTGDGELCWLTTVERRGVWGGTEFGAYWDWHYRKSGQI